ncbi:MAG TPA: phosphatase PAP2 family protein, partial [Anaeromyxobacteraceae bacterium]|nr:phosphatase PAP2 family protein [Anaeromyxobacteraceae bacterium]
MRLHPASRLAAALALLAAAGPAPAEEAGLVPPLAPPSLAPSPDRPAAPRPEVDLAPHLVAAGAAIGLGGALALFQDRLTPPSCRWCEPPAFDRSARAALRWPDTKTAGRASDVLELGVPAASAAVVGLWAWQAGGVREAEEDLVAVGEAAAVTTLATEGVKLAAGRLRPDAWASGAAGEGDSRRSFWSGHTAIAFGTAAAAAQGARLRGRPGWPWLAAAALAGAAATG